MGRLWLVEDWGVYFAPGQYNPDSQEGQELIGHELAHVVQQKQGRVKPDAQQNKGGINLNKDASLEKEADEAGVKAAQAKPAEIKGKGSGVQAKENNDVSSPPVITCNFGFVFGSGGIKVVFRATVDKQLGDFTASYGFGMTYHGKFYSTGKKGLEMRNSLMLDYDNGKNFGASLGTNLWTGMGEMKEFNQRTGMVNFRGKDFGFTYENDGFPFNYIKLGDGGDSYRTAAAAIQIGDFSLNTNLLTGLRNATSFDIEKSLPGGLMGIPEGKGEFGEKYTHGFVFEQGTPYRYGGLTLNYQGQSIGIDSDRWVRHPFQNQLAHDIIKDQRQFKTLSDEINMIFNSADFGLSKFTTWGY